MDDPEPMTVLLTPITLNALRRAVETTQDSTTDTTNRAIQLYAKVVELWEGRAGVLLVVCPDGSRRKLTMY